MGPKDVIQNTMDMCNQILTTYLSDLSNEDLLIRPVAEANHTAWQLGHLIGSEHHMMSSIGVKMPDLPDGFAERHTPETCSSDDPAKYFKKDEYAVQVGRMRDATLAALADMPDSRLDEESPESMRSYAPTIGAVLNLVGLHVLMHASQIVAVRRKLGKPILI